jgi:hypothetical protein
VHNGNAYAAGAELQMQGVVCTPQKPYSTAGEDEETTITGEKWVLGEALEVVTLPIRKT